MAEKGKTAAWLTGANCRPPNMSMPKGTPASRAMPSQVFHRSVN
jgi:hypothetical protein